MDEPTADELEADRAAVAEIAIKLLREQAQSDPKLADMMRSRGLDPEG
jgi:hypothetical protein